MWRFPVTEYSESDKRKLMAKGLEVAVRTMYDTHLFSWGGRVYHQLHGGPILSVSAAPGVRVASRVT